jgi:hypothetical protein
MIVAEVASSTVSRTAVHISEERSPTQLPTS